MGTQLIRLSQIKANLDGFLDFEQQLIAMFGDDSTERYVAIENQSIFTLQKPYILGKNSIKVFVNGILQNPGAENGYIEINQKMISFTEPLYQGDVVVILRQANTYYATLMGQTRAKGYNIYRITYFITEQNQYSFIFDTPMAYQPGLNQLKLYANGMLLSCGASFDYTELSENQFKLTSALDIGTTLTVEVITGGLNIYKCMRYPIFIDQAKSIQRTFLLADTYKMGANTLKLYLNGILLRSGSDNDYVEINTSTFQMNYNLNIGDILEAEITQFTIDVFTIRRVPLEITEANKANMTFTTVVPYTLGESNLRVYLNGILLRAGINEDYVEVNETSFKMNGTTYTSPHTLTLSPLMSGNTEVIILVTSENGDRRYTGYGKRDRKTNRSVDGKRYRSERDHGS
jgi:hypothetical protein